MKDKVLPGGNAFADTGANTKSKNQDLGIKKLHYLEGKYFIVIDRSIAEKLNFSTSTELYFQQNVIEQHSIVLHPYEMRE